MDVKLMSTKDLQATLSKFRRTREATIDMEVAYMGHDALEQQSIYLDESLKAIRAMQDELRRRWEAAEAEDNSLLASTVEYFHIPGRWQGFLRGQWEHGPNGTPVGTYNPNPWINTTVQEVQKKHRQIRWILGPIYTVKMRYYTPGWIRWEPLGWTP